jgi:hypothetical protein
MVAKMKELEPETTRINMVKYVYSECENMPKPTTPQEADLILKFIKKTLRITYEDFEDDIVEDDNGGFDLCKLFCDLTSALNCYCDNEDEVSEVLRFIVHIRKATSNSLDEMMFDGKKIPLSRTKDNCDMTSDENAQLEIISIIHVMNLMAKTAFDKIHDAHRVKRLFKT